MHLFPCASRSLRSQATYHSDFLRISFERPHPPLLLTVQRCSRDDDLARPSRQPRGRTHAQGHEDLHTRRSIFKFSATFCCCCRLCFSRASIAKRGVCKAICQHLKLAESAQSRFCTPGGIMNIYETFYQVLLCREWSATACRFRCWIDQPRAAWS